MYIFLSSAMSAVLQKELISIAHQTTIKSGGDLYFQIYCLARELFLAVEVSILYFRPMMMVYAILLGSLSRAI